ncbi:pentatricopeptide repeat-containing protein At2g33680-like [Humulus lupulus]|uniref:pentatricopeptide repeat-containing protein At2g33680-like n=1 Tax=Humulus lupulus TaxID=3486 RepID=UPI002B40F05F|nr:pentatricopeptide repeat-containing protein At2g33680-like [Humulus lupulus]
MVTVCSTSASWLPATPIPQQSFPALKTRIPSCSSKLFSLNKVIIGQTLKVEEAQDCAFGVVSVREEETLLVNEWPQLIQSSIGSKNLHLGRTIHGFLVKRGSQNDTFEGNNLVNMYSKMKRLDDAQRMFDEMSVRNIITWTSLMKGYSESGDTESVFRIANDMFCTGEKFNEHTCSVILQACNSLEGRKRGEQVHCFAIKSGLDENVTVGTSLISMYSKGGCLSDAEKVFNGIDNKDVRCLNYMILEYGKLGCGEKAMWVFIHLMRSGLLPSEYTYANIISACNGDIGANEGKQLHGLSVKYGVVGESPIGNALITMYGKHGMVEEVERMFETMDERNLISWTAILTAHLRNGNANKAIDIFSETFALGFACDSVSLSIMLDGCSEWRSLELGGQIHGLVIKFGYLSDVKIGTALTDMYAKCGDLQSAKKHYSKLSNKTTALFNAILVGFMESYEDEKEDPMVLFSQLRFEGLYPDFITFSRLLSLSADQASLQVGKSLHAYTIKTGYEADLTVSNALITMYAKCGSVEEAHKMFSGMKSLDSISWNAIISAYALHGHGKRAVSLFEDMKRKGFYPDHITTLAILQACSYSGLLETGLSLFNEMEQKYEIRPVVEHFACVVDLLGRAGQFSEAMGFIKRSPFSDSTLLWRTLVNVCKLYGEMEFGVLASKCLLDLEPEEAGSYILVSNMFAGGGMLDEAAEVRTVMNDLKLSKEPGCSWIEVDDKVHYFVASDMNHPESREIYAELDLLRDEMQRHQSSSDFHLIGQQS